MPSYKEIVTKAVIHKTNNKISKKYEILVENNISKVIGAYILNHKVQGKIVDKIVVINGVFDTNLWYSFDNNTKTQATCNRNSYEEKLNLDEFLEIDDNTEVKINYINLPVCTSADISENKIIYEIEMYLSIQIIGETTIKISTIEDDVIDNNLEIDDININENYLKE